MTALDEAAVVRALLEVPGVAAAQLDRSADGPGVLQVDLTATADEVLLADSVRRMLRDRFGLGVAVERIEAGGKGPFPAAEEPAVAANPLAAVLQLRPSPSPDPASARPLAEPGSTTAALSSAPKGDATAARLPTGQIPADPADPVAGLRPQLGRLQLTRTGLAVAANVELTWSAEHRTIGRAEGPATTEGVRRAVVEAALRAVNAEVGEAVRLDLADFAVVPLGPRKVAVVRVVLSSAAGIAALTGASDVHDDVRQALVRAVLTATNRRLPAPPS